MKILAEMTVKRRGGWELAMAKWVWWCVFVMVSSWSRAGELALTVLSPTNGMLVRGCLIVCTGTSENATTIVWSNRWMGGGMGGRLAGAPEWWFEVGCGHGTNFLTVIAEDDKGGGVTSSVQFLSDQSVIVITSQGPNFVTNVDTFTIFGTGAYLKNIMWWNYYSTSNSTGMIAGSNEWAIEIIGASQGSNRFSVWGFSWLGVLSSDQRWYWVDSIAPEVRLLAPEDGSNVACDVTLVWEVSEQAICTVYTNGGVAGFGTQELTLTGMPAGVYHWFVKAEDWVRNVGYSSTNYFIVPENGVWLVSIGTCWLIRRRQDRLPE